MVNLLEAFQDIADDIKDLIANKITLVSNWIPLSFMPPGYTHSITLAAAKAASARDQITTRGDIRVNVIGGNSDAEWLNPWYLQGWDVWTWFPGVVRRGADCVVGVSNTTTTHPSVQVPDTTTDGDFGILILQKGSSTATPPAPSTVPGWTWTGTTYVTTYSGAYIHLDIYTKTMTAAEKGTILTAPSSSASSQRQAASIAVYGGVSSVVAPVVRLETTGTSSHQTPQITAPPEGLIWVTYYGERTTTPSTLVTPPTGTTLTDVSYGPSAGGSHTVALADSLPNYYNSGTVGGSTAVWVGTTSNQVSLTISLGLVPTSGS